MEPFHANRSVILSSLTAIALALFAAQDAEAFQNPSNRGRAVRDQSIRDASAPTIDRRIQPPAGVKRDALPDRPRLAGRPRERAAVIQAVRDYLKDHSNWLGGVSLQQLRLTYVADLPAGDDGLPMEVVQFVQEHEELEVDGSAVRVVVALGPTESAIVSARANVYPDLDLGPSARKEPSRIRRRGAQALGRDPDRVVLQGERRRIRFLNGRWRRVWEAGDPVSELQVVVDEDTEEFWTEDPRLYVSGTVRGRVVVFDPLNTSSNLSTVPLADLEVVEVRSDSLTPLRTFTSRSFAGTYSFSINWNSGVKAALIGRWASVDGSFASPNLTAQAMPPLPTPTDLLLNPSGADEFPTAQANAFYHATQAHSWMNPAAPPTLPGIDRALPVRVNLDATCNAYYLPVPQPFAPEIVFFRAGDGCLNSAYDTVVYHEYGHFMDDMAGGIRSTDEGRGLSEGWGDVIATFITRQPLVGENFHGSGTFVRTADNTYQLPQFANDEEHNLGQAWAGFAWHLRQRLIARYGQATGESKAKTLFVKTLLANPASFAEAVEDLINADDNDLNLLNGTPNLADIVLAARQHSLPIPDLGFARFRSPSSGEVFRQSDGSISIIGDAVGPSFSQYRLYFAAGLDPLGWNPLTWIPMDLQAPPATNPVTNGPLGTWNVADLPDGSYTLRLVVTAMGIDFEKTIGLALQRTLPVRLDEVPEKASDYPDISGTRVVWEDKRNPRPGLYGDIYICEYNAASGLCPNQLLASGIGEARSPVISGDYVAWADQQTNVQTFATTSQVYVCRYVPGATPCQAQPVGLNGLFQEEPAISGRYIVITQRAQQSGSPRDLYIYDLDNSQRGLQPLVTAPGDQADPAISGISGNRIVWQDNRSGNWDIYSCVYDPQTGTCPETAIETHPADQVAPDISGSLIVWSDWRHGGTLDEYYDNYDLYVYDLNTPQDGSVQITTANRRQSHPAISGNRIVWNDNRNGVANYNLDVGGCVFDTPTKTCPEQAVTFYALSEDYPSIDGNFVVWHGETLPNQVHGVFLAKWNGLPRLQPIPNRTINEGDPLTFTVSATDPDGDTLTYSTSGLPRGATFNPTTHVFTWTPDYTQAGTYAVTFTVADSGGLSTSQPVTITVLDATPPPPAVTIGRPALGTVVNRTQPILLSGTSTAAPGAVVSSVSVLVRDVSVTPVATVFTNVVPITSSNSVSWTTTLPANLASGHKLESKVSAISTPASTSPGVATIYINPDGTVASCSILSAAYGTSYAPAIQTLWAFHHRLVTNWDAQWHRAFLEWYDREGPRVAAFIQNKLLLKALIRIFFTQVARVAQWWLEW